jgi:hypothetical protein
MISSLHLKYGLVRNACLSVSVGSRTCSVVDQNDAATRATQNGRVLIQVCAILQRFVYVAFHAPDATTSDMGLAKYHDVAFCLFGRLAIHCLNSSFAHMSVPSGT